MRAHHEQAAVAAVRQEVLVVRSYVSQCCYRYGQCFSTRHVYGGDGVESEMICAGATDPGSQGGRLGAGVLVLDDPAAAVFRERVI